MSDITMLFGLYFILGLGLTGLLTTWWLLFPGRVAAAHARVARTPGRTFAMGLAGITGSAVPILILFSLPGGPASMMGAILTVLVLTFATLGSAGIASVMAERLSARSEPAMSAPAAYLRGVVALELAAAVPILGWVVFVPIALVFSMGAAIFAVLHWVPRDSAIQRFGDSANSQTSQSPNPRPAEPLAH
jgi:hypothetical protein